MNVGLPGWRGVEGRLWSPRDSVAIAASQPLGHSAAPTEGCEASVRRWVMSRSPACRTGGAQPAACTVTRALSPSLPPRPVSQSCRRQSVLRFWVGIETFSSPLLQHFIPSLIFLQTSSPYVFTEGWIFGRQLHVNCIALLSPALPTVCPQPHLVDGAHIVAGAWSGLPADALTPGQVLRALLREPVCPPLQKGR